VPEQNFWTLWCKGRLTQAVTPTIRLGATPSGWAPLHPAGRHSIRLGATPSGLTSATSTILHLFTGRMPFLPPTNSVKALKD